MMNLAPKQKEPRLCIWEDRLNGRCGAVIRTPMSPQHATCEWHSLAFADLPSERRRELRAKAAAVTVVAE